MYARTHSKGTNKQYRVQVRPLIPSNEDMNTLPRKRSLGSCDVAGGQWKGSSDYLIRTFTQAGTSMKVDTLGKSLVWQKAIAMVSGREVEKECGFYKEAI